MHIWKCNKLKRQFVKIICFEKNVKYLALQQYCRVKWSYGWHNTLCVRQRALKNPYLKNFPSVMPFSGILHLVHKHSGLYLMRTILHGSTFSLPDHKCFSYISSVRTWNNLTARQIYKIIYHTSSDLQEKKHFRCSSAVLRFHSKFTVSV